MVENAGGWEEFELWMELYGYTQETLLTALTQEIESAWMVVFYCRSGTRDRRSSARPAHPGRIGV